MNAPQDKGAVGWVSWLARQLDDAPGDLVIEAYPKNARTGTSATFAEVREERQAVLDTDAGEPHRFKIIMRSEMGMARRTGTRSPGFISTVLKLIESFYGGVVQQITQWQPPAPKLKPQKLTPEVDEDKPRITDPYRWSQDESEEDSQGWR